MRPRSNRKKHIRGIYAACPDWLHLHDTLRGMQELSSMSARWLAGSLASLLLLLPSAVRAQAEWPQRPVRLVLPFVAGGGTDITARLLAQRMTDRLRQPVLIENRAGGQGNIGAQVVARAAPDGYTMLYNTSFIVTSPAMTTAMSYDWRRDLTPVVGTVSVPLILLVHPSVPARTPAEFVTLLKARGTELSYSSAGIGNTTHLAVVRLLREIGASSTHIPYSGGGPALTDLMRGMVQFYMDTTNTAIGYIRDGSVHAIAIGSARRVDSLAEVPTVTESMLAGYTAESWAGVMAPAGTASTIIERFSREMLAVLAEPELQARLEQSSTIPTALGTEAYRVFLESEAAKWQAVIQAASIRLE